MVNGAGPAAVVHSRPGRYVFQTSVPYAVYGLDVLRVANSAELSKLYILARDDVASREMAEATRNAALNGFAPGEVELYRPGTVDFTLQVARARAAQADAWIAFGDVRDAAEMVKTFKRLDYAPKLFFANAVSHPRYIALLGQDAEFSLGVVDFDPRLGDEAREFARAYTARWKVPPQLTAAEGYVAGTVLAAALRSAGRLDQERLRAALAELELPTALGGYRVSPENGAQIGFKPVGGADPQGAPGARHAAPALPAMEREGLDQKMNRSFLFAPGNVARRVEKALTLDADAVIVDLEDSVAIAEKAATRKAVADALSRPRRGRGYVRVNAPSTAFCYGDLTQTIHKGVDGIVLPKVESAADLHAIDWLIWNLERERGIAEGSIDLMPQIETAAGLHRIDRVLQARSLRPYKGPWRVKRVAFGAADYAHELGLSVSS